MSVDPTPSQPTAEEFSAMVHDLTSMTDGAVPSSSQMRAARVLATTAASRLRHIFGTPTGWHWWDGMRWKPDGSNHARSELFTVVEKHLPSLVLLGVLPKSTVSELQRDNSQRGTLAIASHLPVRDGVKIMLEKNVSCLPVLENGALVGIISWKDFLKVALESDALD